MNDLKSEKSAQFRSVLIVWILMCFTFYLIGLLIENVDSTIYPAVAGLLLVYLTVGHLVLKDKEFNPVSSPRILRGKVDKIWALKHLFWACWWPLYLCNSGKH